jgi:hypothetical protein
MSILRGSTIFTTALGRVKFEVFRAKLDMRPVPEGH